MQDYRDESNTDKSNHGNFTMEIINAINDQLEKNIFKGMYLCSQQCMIKGFTLYFSFMHKGNFQTSSSIKYIIFGRNSFWKFSTFYNILGPYGKIIGPDGEHSVDLINNFIKDHLNVQGKHVLVIGKPNFKFEILPLNWNQQKTQLILWIL